MNKQTLNLFNAIQVEDTNVNFDSNYKYSSLMKQGIIVHPAIPRTKEIIDLILNNVKLNKKELNSTFRKSWKIIEESSEEDLYFHQLVHYITTYGFKELGIFSNSTVYIPNDSVRIPSLKGNIEFITVNALTKEDVLEKIKILVSGIALKESTIDDIFDIIVENKYDKSIIEYVKNRELLLKLYDHFNVFPTAIEDFFKYWIYKVTDKTLIIKNDYMFSLIEDSDFDSRNFIKNAPIELASIFYRYKPLFLALKRQSPNKGFFNRLRKNAIKLHKPLPIDYLNSITKMISNKTLNIDKLKNKLKNATIYRKIRLLNSLKFRTCNNNNSIVHTIRNGRSWVKDFEWNGDIDYLNSIIDVIVQSIVSNFNVKGKKFLIPENVNYAVPATEKQFIGMLPIGSSITVDDDMMIGVYWKDVGGTTDLDFSLIDEDGFKIGWNGNQKTDNIMFSGDITSAPNGATEVLYIKKAMSKKAIINLNYYNHYGESPSIPYRLFVAKEKIKNGFNLGYMVNPNNVLIEISSYIDVQDKINGVIVNTNGRNTVYFAETSFSKAISSYDSVISKKARDYFINSLQTVLTFNELIVLAGGTIITELPEDIDIDIVDLSPNKLKKDTFIELLNN